MALKITITGRVHGVGYRLFLLEEADYLFIPRFDARNVKIDGKEALIVLVDGEKEQLEEFAEFVKTNKPENAIVDEIRIEEYGGRVREIEKFRSSLNTSQLSKIVQVGLKMIEKQDNMLEKQDTMLGKMDLMLEKQDTMLGKMGVIIEKQDETIKGIHEVKDAVKEEGEKTRKHFGGKVDELRSDLRDYLDERLKKIEEEIKAIKAKIGMS